MRSLEALFIPQSGEINEGNIRVTYQNLWNHLPAHPDGNLVSLAPDVDDCPVDKLSMVLSKSLPDQQEEHFHPEVVQVKTPHVSIQTDQPPSDTTNKMTSKIVLIEHGRYFVDELTSLRPCCVDPPTWA